MRSGSTRLTPVAMAGARPCGRLHKIKVKIIVGKNRTAHRGHTDGVFAQTHFIHHFGHQAVSDAVRAARAVMRVDIGQRFGALVNDCFHFYSH